MPWIQVHRSDRRWHYLDGSGHGACKTSEKKTEATGYAYDPSVMCPGRPCVKCLQMAGQAKVPVVWTVPDAPPHEFREPLEYSAGRTWSDRRFETCRRCGKECEIVEVAGKVYKADAGTVSQHKCPTEYEGIMRDIRRRLKGVEV